MVNLLWVFSLVISLACATLATMLQQWARQYIAFIQLPQDSPRDRARIRALFADSADKLFLKTMGILMVCSLHMAILLFFIGLLIFFHNVNHTIFIFMLLFFVFCMTIYTFFTVLPLFQASSLLYTPVSALPATFILLSICLIHSTFADRFRFKRWRFFEWLFEGVDNVEDISSTPIPELDARILELTLNSLSEDDAMEKSFAAIPDLFDENLDPSNLSKDLQEAFKTALYRFLDYTFRSTTVAESVKNHRLTICLKASSAVLDPVGFREILQEILNGRWPELLRSVEMGLSLRSWVEPSDKENVSYIQEIISRIVENAEKRDDRWLALAADQPGMSENLFQYYLVDNIFLDRPSSYPLCNTVGRRLDSTNVYNEDVSLAIHSGIQSAPLHNPVLVSGTQPFNMAIPHPYTPANQPSLLARLDGPSVLSGNSSLNVAAVDARQGNPDISTPNFDQNILIPMEISRHPSKSAPSTPNIAANILRPGDSQQDLNQS